MLKASILGGFLSPQSKQRAGQGDTGSGPQGCAHKENVRRGCSFQGCRKGNRSAGSGEDALPGQVQTGTE